MRNIFTRSKKNPVIKPNSNHPWESKKVFNPGAVWHKGKYHLFYRATGMGKGWYSALGYAASTDGEHFERFSEPILDINPSNPLEKRGLEDPRITEIDGTFFMAYAAYDGIVPRLHVATSQDLQTWKKPPPALRNFSFSKMGGSYIKWHNGKPQELPLSELKKMDERTKAGGIFPAKINGRYWLLFNEFRIWMASSKDGINWEVEDPKPFLEPRRKTDLFDNVFVEMGPPPIKTEKGWLVLYHGVNDAIQYHLGVLLLDENDPKKILYRSEEPIFGPREDYELSGLVDIIPGIMDMYERGNEKEIRDLIKKAEREGFMPQVTFTPSAVNVDGIVRLFYGASDQFICTATAPLDDILATIP